jgi:hypothetical protein
MRLDVMRFTRGDLAHMSLSRRPITKVSDRELVYQRDLFLFIMNSSVGKDETFRKANAYFYLAATELNRRSKLKDVSETPLAVGQAL